MHLFDFYSVAAAWIFWTVVYSCSYHWNGLYKRRISLLSIVFNMLDEFLFVCHSHFFYFTLLIITLRKIDMKDYSYRLFYELITKRL